MVEETPAEQWKPENLTSLTRRSLQMLIDCVENAYKSGSADARIMDHFFLSDTAVYLRGVDVSSSQNVSEGLNQAAAALRDAVVRLPQLLLQFKDNLQPVTHSGRFHFHPFLVLPILLDSSSQMSNAKECEYHEIYDIVKEAVLCLSDEYYSSERLSELIDKLPDCARSARESLRAMNLIKLGDIETAATVVNECRGIGVSRGIDWPAERLANEATAEFVWQHLRSRDSAWKFCFLFYEQLHFSFVTFPDDVFPLQLENYGNFFYINFDALLQGLHFELETTGDAMAQLWIRDVALRADADQQELVVAASSCEDLQLLRLLRRRISQMLGDVPDWLQWKVEELAEAAGSV